MIETNTLVWLAVAVVLAIAFFLSITSLIKCRKSLKDAEKNSHYYQSRFEIEHRNFEHFSHDHKNDKILWHEELERKLIEARSQCEKEAREKFDRELKEKEQFWVNWAREEELKAAVNLEKWKGDELEKTVKDSVNRSRTILRGKTVEQFAPFTEEFTKDFAPSDAKFLGSPIDYIIFKNASAVTDGEDVPVTIYLMDVKTGKSQLNKVQRAIKEAVLNHRIEWKTLEFDTVSK